MKSPLTTEELSKLKSHLRHGDIRMLARKCKCSPYTINLFFRGTTYRDTILEAVMNLIDSRASISKRLEKLIAKTTPAKP